MTSTIDVSTLGWVKAEIDETLKQARQALESFVENPTDDSQLRFCTTHLHQVVGTLEMVELDGAAMLARETEALAEAILNEDLPADDKVYDVLTRGILTLPDYLARLQFGSQDVPLRLLPLLNELRTVRNSPPILELDLFNPDLSVRPPRKENKKEHTTEEYSGIAKKLRPVFQVALLAWLRDTNSKGALDTMLKILGKLEDEANLGLVEQLFWVASGLLDAMLAKDLEITNERKKLLARLDQQIRKLVEGVGRAELRQSSEDLIKSILFQVANAKLAASSPKVVQLKQAFDLDGLLGRAPVAEEEQEALPTPEALQSVSEALAQEILDAQDMLAAYFDPEQEQVNTLAPLRDVLGKMSSTMEMLGVPLLKTLIDALSDTCNTLEQGKLERNESVSMTMARALLLIESSARDIHSSAGAWKRQIDEVIATLQGMATGNADVMPTADGLEVSDAELTESDYRQLLNVVADEIRVNLSNIEEIIESFVADTSQTGSMEHVVQHLGQIQGALQILGQDHAAELAIKTAGFAEDIYSGVLAPDEEVMDPFAVCVGTIGAYIDGLLFNRPHLDDLVDMALEDMELATRQRRNYAVNPSALVAAIERDYEVWVGDPGNQDVTTNLQQHLQEIGQIAGEQSEDRIVKISEELLNLVQIVSTDPGQLNQEIQDTFTQSLETLGNLCRQNLAAPAQTQVHVVDKAADIGLDNTAMRNNDIVVEQPALQPTVGSVTASPTQPLDQSDEDFDEEIMEIFIEDAKDSLDTINKNFPLWRDDPSDDAAMLEVRRAFHTIKGSGRMVGAGQIAELAWAVENLLNRVRDKKVVLSDVITEHVEKVRVVLPQLISQLEGGPAATADIEGLRLQVHALAEGKSIDSAASTADRADINEELTPKVDPTLLQIFTNEALGHVQTIEDLLAECESGGGCLASPGLIRASHTLAGSARSVGLMPMSDTCKEMEKLLQEMGTHQLMLSGQHIKLLKEMSAYVDTLIRELNANGATTQPTLDLFHNLASRIASARKDLDVSVLAYPGASGSQVIPPAASEETLDLGVDMGASTPAQPTVDKVPEVMPPVPPSVPTAAPSAPARPAVVDKIDTDLVEIFYEEAVDILHNINESVAGWRKNPKDRATVADLKRALHTFKGGARMSGVMSLGALAHETETMLGLVEQGKIEANRELMDLLDEIHDTLAAAIEQVRENEAITGIASVATRIHHLVDGKPVPVASSQSQTLAPQRPTVQSPVSNEPADTASTVIEQVTPMPMDMGDDVSEEDKPERVAGGEKREQIRVRTDLLNDLANYAGEVSISRARMEEQIFGFHENLGELQRSVVRFREQLRELEIQSESQILFRTEAEAEDDTSDFDPLEFDRFSRLQQLSRSLTEGLHDLTTIQHNLGNFASEAETVLQQQARVNTDLQEGLMRTRMIDFNTQAARLRHIVRQTSRELGKRANLDIIGGEVELDRNVLERIIGPFEHMIRNALDHGIESESERKRKGKPAIGTIRIETRHEGNEIVIHFSDDGAGLDINQIRKKAIERGLMAEDASLSEEEVMQFILVAGFSTATAVTHISGRGVGMDVVHNEVRQLGGNMSVDTDRGHGTTFAIRLPLTLSITQALMVYVGEQLFAVPLSTVINILEIPTKQLMNIYVGEKPLLNYEEHVYPFMHLATHLGVSHATTDSSKVPVLLARSGSREVAMQVDGLSGTREIVIKPIGAQLTEVNGLAGATILGDGQVVLILDIAGLWQTADVMHVSHRPAMQPAKPQQDAKRHAVIMVVDDSLTVRKVTTKFLLKNGMEALTAKDGLDAVEQLREHIPDLMLVDIEMPRMDGYELTKRVRSDPTLKHIPIIMITSRAGAKHKQKALDLGVNDYMSKPYQEEQLADKIKMLLGR